MIPSFLLHLSFKWHCVDGGKRLGFGGEQGSLTEMPSASSGLQNDNLFSLLGFTSTALAGSAWLYQRVGVFQSLSALPMQTQQHLPPPGSPPFTALLEGP